MKNRSEEVIKIMGRKVTELRIKAGLSQLETAKSIGIARTSLTNIENGNQSITPFTMMKFIKLFKCTYDDIFPSQEEVLLPIKDGRQTKHDIKKLKKIQKLTDELKSLLGNEHQPERTVLGIMHPELHDLKD